MGEVGERDDLSELSERVQRRFEGERRLLSFAEYLELFTAEPVRFSRDAGRYVRDMFDYFGRDQVRRPWGTSWRYRLFDLEFLDDAEGKRRALVGHEQLQGEVYRVLCNFVHEGRPNRVILMHGPNGSAKSTVAYCVMRALENYSSLDAGALYRFHWVFPNQESLRGAIGFRGERTRLPSSESYARLGSDALDARVVVEVRDHPLFLIPHPERIELLQRAYREVGATEPPPEWVLRGGLSHKSRQIYEGLLASYDGSLVEVLRHVQVERYFISRRYRIGAVTLGPELSVDAQERQVTADRSLAALPAALQSLSLYDVHGELVDAAGGVIEFSDLLKRPLDAFKYLQITAETGEVALPSQNLQVNSVMLASGNELHLAAFREHPEFQSFRGRLELIRAPYLLDYRDEQQIYDAQVAPLVRRVVAPHVTRIAAMFAVLTRLLRPDPDAYEPPIRALVADLTAMEKLELYATGGAPERLDVDGQKQIRSVLEALARETDSSVDYEGASGASPREMRGVLLDAAQDPRYDYLSPFAVLDGLERLCSRVSEYAWLQRDAEQGGYHDHALFRRELRLHLLDLIDEEFRRASGLVDEARYGELFDRYLNQVGAWVESEKLRNPITGSYEDPDERLMDEVEKLLGAPEEATVWRQSLMSRVAAWAIEHPGRPVERERIFDEELRRLREAAFREQRDVLARLCRDLVVLVREEGVGLDDGRRRLAGEFVESLSSRYGYQPAAAADAAVVLLRERFDTPIS